jgi:hypothetical protein
MKRVFDLNGREVYSTPIYPVNSEINTADFENGIYILRIQDVNNVVSEKLIINH